MKRKYVPSQKRSRLNHIHSMYTKKLKCCVFINSRLRNRIAALSSQNKLFSTTRNNLMLEKFELANENRSLQNQNVQLTKMHHTVMQKISELDQNLQSCIPALVTLSKYIPSMMKCVHELTELDKFKMKNKECQKKTVNHEVNNQYQLDLSSINEISFSEQSPMSSKCSKQKSGLLANNVDFESHTEPCPVPCSENYLKICSKPSVSLKVSDDKSSRCQIEVNYDEESSGLHAQEIPSKHCVTKSSKNNSAFLNDITKSMINEIPPPVKNVAFELDPIQTDQSTSKFSQNNYANIIHNENEEHNNKSSVSRNVASHKRYDTRLSSKSSVALDEGLNSPSSIALLDVDFESHTEPCTLPRSEHYLKLCSKPSVSLKVSDDKSSRCQIEVNYDEESSRLHSQEIPTKHCVTKSSKNNSAVLNDITKSMINEIPRPVKKVAFKLDSIQTNQSTSKFSQNNYANIIHNENEEPNNESSVSKNVASHKRYNTRLSGNSSVALDEGLNSSSSIALDEETNSSLRSIRSRKKPVNYKLPQLNTKLRRP